MRAHVGIRVWLPLAFALVAAVTAVVVERSVSSGSEAAFRDRAQELAAGDAFESALEIGTGASRTSSASSRKPPTDIGWRSSSSPGTGRS